MPSEHDDDLDRPLLGHSQSEVPARNNHKHKNCYPPISRARLRSMLSSRSKHYIVLGLVALDVTAILINVFLELIACDIRQDEGKKPAWIPRTARALTTAGLVFSCLFLAELLLCVAVYGLAYFGDWFHCVDALVIVASFVADLLSHGIVEEIASLVVVFRLFRFVKLVEEISAGAAERMDDLEAEVSGLREENERLKSALDARPPAGSG